MINYMFSVKILHLFLLASLGLGATPETPKMRLICEKELEGFVLIHLNDSETRTAYEIRARYYRTLQHHIHLKRLRLNDEKNRARIS